VPTPAAYVVEDIAQYESSLPVNSLVNIQTFPDPAKGWNGMGVYVGDGKIWTVAHLFPSAKPEVMFVEITQLGPYRNVVFHGSAHVIALDRRSDAAILALDQVGSTLRPLAVCKMSPNGGEFVQFLRYGHMSGGGIVANSVTWSRLERDPGRLDKDLYVRDALDHGYSGSPVISQNGDCFYGIVSIQDFDVTSTVTVVDHEDRPLLFCNGKTDIVRPEAYPALKGVEEGMPPMVQLQAGQCSLR
jgi:hypothetical protein